ncbi:MAG: FAD-dependent monooxygenase [Paracoccaceae bacterium]|jgi:salicylate hydroxylase
MSVQGQEIIVVGAGIAGLAAACSLALLGARVRVLEQAAELRTAGAGIQISPNGARVLQALGLMEALESVGMRASSVMLRDGLLGHQVSKTTLGPMFYYLHRADLLGLLADGARNTGVVIEFGQKISAPDLSGSFPKIMGPDGRIYQAEIVIGADGVHSTVRSALNGLKQPKYTGYVAWRALISAQPNEQELAVAEVFMAPKRHFVSYPLRSGSLRNLIGIEARPNLTPEGWTHRETPVNFRTAFTGFAPRVQEWLVVLGEKPDIGFWGLYSHEDCAHWGRALPKGGVAILGDAAHPTLPFMAQGANLALEDAFVLAQALDNCQDLGQALGSYQALRAGRTRAVLFAAQQNGRAYHLGGGARALAHGALRLGGDIAARIAFNRYGWIYNYDVTKTA